MIAHSLLDGEHVSTIHQSLVDRLVNLLARLRHERLGHDARAMVEVNQQDQILRGVLLEDDVDVHMKSRHHGIGHA
jgi:hypothetical protein